MSSFSRSCEQVLRDNDRGRYTVPSPRLYPHQWAWDSAFAAIGWAHLDRERAWVELSCLMEGQWEDGRVPHIVFHVPGDYFPGPDFWETERSSSISQPPVWASAARRLVELGGPHPALDRLLDGFEASHLFFHHQRDPLGWGLVAVVHPWESGLDNCPAWDEPMRRVDVSDPPAFRRRDTVVAGDPSVRPTDDDYLRYACLVKAIARDGFGPGPFAVYDPMFSAILARAERDLAWLCELRGRPSQAATRADAIEHALQQHLYDEELGRFVYHDAHADQRIACDVIGAYLPLMGNLPSAVAARLRSGLRERYATRWPLPSTAPSDPHFDARRYWRGPTWVNVNWLLRDVLGPSLVESTLGLVERSGFREYYHPDTGEGLGGEQFTWTAALALDLAG